MLINRANAYYTKSGANQYINTVPATFRPVANNINTIRPAWRGSMTQVLLFTAII